MAALILPSRFTRQPQIAVRVDSSNPISKSLSFAWSAGAGQFDSVSGIVTPGSATGNITSTVSASGRGRQYLNAGNDSWLNPSPNGGVKTFAVVLLYTVAPGGLDPAMVKPGFAGWGFKFNTGAVMRFVNNSVTIATDPVAITVGTTYLYTGVADGTTGYLYRNGVLVASGALAGGVIANTGAISFGFDAAAGSQGSGTVLGGWIWERALNANEVAAFSANPWQVFKAPPRKLYLAASSFSGKGTAAASSTAPATGAATTAGKGSSGGVAVASGTGAATATASASSAGTSTAPASGASTGTTTGTATATSSAPAAGAETAAGTGTSNATSASSAVGSATGATTGTASATSTAAATGAANIASIGSASASSTAPAVGAETIAAAGSSSANSTAPAVGAAIASSTGTSSGSSTAPATAGASVTAGVGTANATSTAPSTGAATISAVGTSPASSTTSASGAAVAASVGTASATSAAVGTASETASATGTSAASSSAAGVTAATASATGTSGATSYASAIGSPIAAATGSIAAISTAIATGTVVTDPRYAKPSADLIAGNWLPSSGSSLSAMLNEAIENDATYIRTTSASTCEVALNAVANPGTTSGQVVRYSAWSAFGNGLTVVLKMGTTTIATWTVATLPTTPTLYEQNLTPAQIATITDYTALRLDMTAA